MSNKSTGSKSATKIVEKSESSQPKPHLFLDQLEVDNGHLLCESIGEFDGETTTRKVSADPHGYLRYPFQLMAFDQIEPANNKYLIDNLCGRELKIDNSSVAPTKAVLAVDCSLPKEGTLENLLIYAVNRQNQCMQDSPVVGKNILFILPHGIYKSFVFTESNLPLKDVTQQHGKWLCEACNRTVDYPVLGNGTYVSYKLLIKMQCMVFLTFPPPHSLCRYRIEVVVADDTAHTVVVMFNDTSTELVKCSAESLMAADNEGAKADDDSNFPTAIRNLIGTTHVLEIKSHTYYEYGTFESFTCWKINSSGPVEDSASSSTPTLTANDAVPSMKRLSRHPTVCTPSEPNVEKKKRVSTSLIEIQHKEKRQ
ncbi:DNA helicase PIF1, ATP-dependent [Tanacetum coccineum]